MSPAEQYPGNTNDHELIGVDLISPVVVMGSLTVAETVVIPRELQPDFDGFKD